MSRNRNKVDKKLRQEKFESFEQNDKREASKSTQSTRKPSVRAKLGKDVPEIATEKTEYAAKPQTVEDVRESIITPGFGLSVPAFRRYSNVDEETYIPLGFIHGHYTPEGVDAPSEYYSQLSTMYLQGLLVSLRDLGYPQEYTVDDLRDYFSAASTVLQFITFVNTLRTLSDYSSYHSSPVTTAVTIDGISGRLVAAQKVGVKVFANMPYPQSWEDAYVKGFGPTTLSSSPFSAVRAFAPKSIQPAVDGTEGYVASDITDAFRLAIANLATESNSRLASVLGKVVTPNRAELPLFGNNYIPQNHAVINNILNLPFFNGTTHEPDYGDDVSVKYFYRDQIVPHGMLTFAPDDNVLATIQGTVWLQQASAAESSSTLIAISNDGIAVDATADTDLFSNFGSIWEADARVAGSPSPSVSYVYTSFTGVANGVQTMLLS